MVPTSQTSSFVVRRGARAGPGTPRHWWFITVADGTRNIDGGEHARHHGRCAHGSTADRRALRCRPGRAPPVSVDLVFDGWIAGVGTREGTRAVLGRWSSSPWGAFADVMVERPDGHRILLAPTH